MVHSVWLYNNNVDYLAITEREKASEKWRGIPSTLTGFTGTVKFVRSPVPQRSYTSAGGLVSMK